MKVKREKVRLSWSDPRFRAYVYQALILGLVVYVVWFLVSNTLDNLAARNINTGFAFLKQEAGFAIGESYIEYSLTDTYTRALGVGIINTLVVSFLGIILSTLLGILIGVARLSANWLIHKLAAIYVEVMRNIPLLIHLFFWYALFTEIFPGPRQALNPISGVFISNRGIMLPSVQGASLLWMALACALALVLTIVLAVYGKKRQRLTGQTLPVLWIALALIVLLPAIAALLSGLQLNLNLPELRGFNFQGGMSFTPELTALLAGLVFYTAAFVAEIVRSGIQSIGKGQWEAGRSIGLRNGQVLRLVVMPQALRVIVPPMSSTFMNLAKNSSLAVAIGYPDIVSIVNTMLTQTGQAIEAVSIIMLAYLTISLSIALLMNWYNQRIALVER